ncbi:MAG: hypothetical protein V8S26_08340 [Lachnospiraceae bacterium]
MANEIKLIEDLSLNAWPSHQMQIYDSWILRFSYFYTHRTNSVEQLGPSTIPLDKRLPTVNPSTGTGAHPVFSKLILFWSLLLTPCWKKDAMKSNTQQTS